jgi:hypothetical protein
MSALSCMRPVITHSAQRSSFVAIALVWTGPFTLSAPSSGAWLGPDATPLRWKQWPARLTAQDTASQGRTPGRAKFPSISFLSFVLHSSHARRMATQPSRENYQDIAHRTRALGGCCATDSHGRVYSEVHKYQCTSKARPTKQHETERAEYVSSVTIRQSGCLEIPSGEHRGHHT